MVTPSIVLGTAQWGIDGYGIANQTGRVPDETIASLLDRAWSRGSRWLDTARAYGSSEERIGALATRHPWKVVTKLDPRCGTAADPAAAARESLTASAAALRRDHLDVVLLHRPDQRIAHGGAIWNVMRKAKQDGLVGRIGISATHPGEALEALDAHDVDAMQVASNVLDQRLLRAGFFDRAAAAGRFIHVRSVFLQGVAFLDSGAIRAQLPGLVDAVRALDDEASRLGRARWQLFLRWARRLPVDGLALGFESRDQFDASCACLTDEPLEVEPTWGSFAVDAPDWVDPSRWPRDR